MLRIQSTVAVGAALLTLAAVAPVGAHPGHEGEPADPLHWTLAEGQAVREPIVLAQAEGEPAAKRDKKAKSGQGRYKFRVLYTSDHLPEEAVKVLKAAHGGFAVDRREDQGHTYFALPGAGILRIAPDLSSVDLLETAEPVKANNMHNTTIWTDSEGTPYLTFPSNGTAQVFTTDLEGKLLGTLGAPTKDDKFGRDAVNDYFAKGQGFVPTDTEVYQGLLYVATGYSSLDYVLTAHVESASEMTWDTLAFGGKGTKPGQFGTGHGITVVPGAEMIAVADRPNSEIEFFSPEGDYIVRLGLPEGSFPCDVDFVEDYTLVGCLHGPDREKGAPIYLLKGDQLISTVMPKEDLGLANFQHIHNSVLRVIDGKLYIIAQAWNPGDFAILEQVKFGE